MKRLTFFGTYSRILSVVGLVIFAGVGAYLLFYAHADDGEGPWWHVNAFRNVTEGNGLPAGTPFTNVWSVNYSESPRPSPVPWRMILHYTSNRKQVELLGFSCNPNICRQMPGIMGQGWQHYPDFVICIDVTQSLRETYQSSIAGLLTIRLKAKTDMHPVSVTWNEMREGVASGSCDSPLSASDVQWQGGSGECFDGGQVPPNYSYPCNDGTPLYPGPVNPGNTTPTDTGDAPSGSGNASNNAASASGGGTSANKQSHNPSTIPSSSPQGNSGQTDIDPSPFFDGEEFKRGSDPDTLAHTISSAGKKVVRTWPVVLAVIALGGMAGLVYWKWRRR